MTRIHRGAHESFASGDAALAAVLLSATALYCWWLPHAIGSSDEGIFLYEAKRVAEGAVLYREVFDLITPLSTVAMAALFRIFGATVATARAADAVIHGSIVLAIFAIARRLGVRRSLATAAGLLYPAWLRPIWDVSSPHWLSTLLGLGLLGELLRTPTARPMRTGLWAASIIAVQQQRGLPLAVAAVVVLALDGWGAQELRGAARRLAGFATGMLLVGVPLGAYVLWTAGVAPVLEALVIYPLRNYGHLAYGIPWGAGTAPWAKRYTLPEVVARLPVLVVPEALRAAVEYRRRRQRWRQSAILVLYALAAVASILYLPDLIHIAFIAPVFLVLVADQLEGIFRILPGWRVASLLRAAAVSGLIAVSVIQLRQVMVGRWRDFPFGYDSPFGRVYFATAAEVALRDQIRRRLDDVPGRRLFVYPGGAAVYLETGATNPTPYQVLVPGYNPPAAFAQVVEILDRERTPYVLWAGFIFEHDPLRGYLQETYGLAPDVRERVLLRRLNAVRDGSAAMSRTAEEER